MVGLAQLVYVCIRQNSLVPRLSLHVNEKLQVTESWVGPGNEHKCDLQSVRLMVGLAQVVCVCISQKYVYNVDPLDVTWLYI